MVGGGGGGAYARIVGLVLVACRATFHYCFLNHFLPFSSSIYCFPEARDLSSNTGPAAGPSDNNIVVYVSFCLHACVSECVCACDERFQQRE